MGKRIDFADVKHSRRSGQLWDGSLVCILQIIVIVSRHPERTARRIVEIGRSSFSQSASGALECTIVIAPIVLMDLHDSYFLAVYGTCWVIATLNFIWMIIVARRWKLADGRTSLQAYRDRQLDLKELEVGGNHPSHDAFSREHSGSPVGPDTR